MGKITKEPFFKTPQGDALLYTLENKNGLKAQISTFGGALARLWTPDRQGDFADIVLGYDGYEGYASRTYFLGDIVGRCCNRIAGGRFVLNGKEYQLACNDNGVNHLHGGGAGFDVKLWQARTEEKETEQILHLSYTSPHGEEGYPGNLQVQVSYCLDDENRLTLRYEAQCDAPTICSLTNHSYFNLAGHDSGDVLKQQLKLYANAFLPTDKNSIPTGEIMPVEGTAMDFREFHAIGQRIDDPMLKNARGYDHNWVLEKPKGSLGLCAQAWDPQSGRFLSCRTTMPGVQVYTANYVDKTQRGKNGCYYGPRWGFCLETQYWPDAVHHPQWDSPILNPGETYSHITEFSFSVK